jgi:hypothetical protein
MKKANKFPVLNRPIYGQFCNINILMARSVPWGKDLRFCCLITAPYLHMFGFPKGGGISAQLEFCSRTRKPKFVDYNRQLL